MTSILFILGLISDIGRVNWVSVTPNPPVIGQDIIMRASVNFSKKIIKNSTT